MTESGIYVYVSQQGGRQISVFRMSPATGELSTVQDISATGTVMPMGPTGSRS
jgi:6-phosphogluconolactonase (cycloisomerase 2 family)